MRPRPFFFTNDNGPSARHHSSVLWTCWKPIRFVTLCALHKDGFDFLGFSSSFSNLRSFPFLKSISKLVLGLYVGCCRLLLWLHCDGSKTRLKRPRGRKNQATSGYRYIPTHTHHSSATVTNRVWPDSNSCSLMRICNKKWPAP